MKFPVVKKAQRLMDTEGVVYSDFTEKPLNGSKYTEEDVLRVIEDKKVKDSGLQEQEGDFFKEPDSMTTTTIVAEVEDSAPATISNEPSDTVVQYPPILEFYWKDAEKADELVKKGLYIITESRSTGSKEYGMHKLLVLKKRG